MQPEIDSNILTPHESRHSFLKFNHSFYSRIRNEINEDRLAYLHQFALNIEEPKIFGTFENSTNYLKTLRLLQLSTQATKYRKFFLIKFIPKILKTFESFLDVGCADGIETKLLIKYFQKIYALDIDKIKLDQFKIGNKRNKMIAKLNTNILNFEFSRNQYDLILFSHCLYYIDENKWMSLIKKAFYSLKPNGSIAIIITCNKDKKKIAQHFKGHYLKIDNFIKESYQFFENAQIESIISEENFITNHIIDMAHICNMHLKDATATCTREELFSFIQNNLSVENRYEFHAEQIFLIIKEISH